MRSNAALISAVASISAPAAGIKSVSSQRDCWYEIFESVIPVFPHFFQESRGESGAAGQWAGALVSAGPGSTIAASRCPVQTGSGELPDEWTLCGRHIPASHRP